MTKKTDGQRAGDRNALLLSAGDPIGPLLRVVRDADRREQLHHAITAPETKPVLADEPTANLDSATAHRVIDLMRRLKTELGVTFVFSTHDPKIMAEAEIIHHLRLRSGT